MDKLKAAGLISNKTCYYMSLRKAAIIIVHVTIIHYEILTLYYVMYDYYATRTHGRNDDR